jgi:hypothetical protein
MRQSSEFEYTPAPYGDSKDGLVGVWAVAWPVKNDKHKDRKGGGGGDLERCERGECDAHDPRYVRHREIFCLLEEQVLERALRSRSS